ncbi:MAG TPA: MlaD family protein [Candidatus Babeliales bacterium]|nr:MlaD family protein [Candidatus Babeliales bacterium]
MKPETTVGILVIVGVAIFFYMGFKIDAFRFDTSKYNSYMVYFKDVAGLTRKAEVKVAGVKVGWVDTITLVNDHNMTVHAQVKVLNEYSLHSDAYAVVRQDGLLGPKYLEIITGDPTLPIIPNEGVLQEPSIEPASIDELLLSLKKIASNVESITDSFQAAIGGVQGEEQLKSIFNNLHETTNNLTSFSNSLERSFARNEDHLDSLLQIGTQVRRVADRLDDHVLPSFQDSVEKIATVVDRDFDRVATQLTSTAQALEDVSIQARDGFSSITSIADKIDNGTGLIGKLINEDETYRDMKVAVQGLKNYFAKIDMLEIVFDVHGETMQRPADGWKYEDSKLFFDMRIHPNRDHFYILQIAGSERGYREEVLNLRDYSTKNDEMVDTESLTLSDRSRLQFTFDRKDTYWRRNQIRVGIQFGKIFRDLAFRFGLIEGFGGVGVDYDIPFDNDKFRWVTSLEIFDITGWNHRSKRYSNVEIDDRRPHLKWINKMYILKNLYVVFGADDFVSKNNANAFFGAGIRFGDDDVKYLLPSLGGARGFAKG